MSKPQVLFVVLFVACPVLSWGAELPKPSYARTVLKVSRSLPGETEELKVRTSDGELATLIVKKRERSSTDPRRSSTSSEPEQKEVASNSVTESTPGDVGASSSITREEIRKLENEQVEEIRSKFSISPETPKNRSEDDRSSSSRDKFEQVDYGSWTPLDQNGRALKTNPEERTTEAYLSWKPVQTDPTSTSEDRMDFPRYQSPVLQSRSLILPSRGFEALNPSKIVNNEGTYAFLRHQPRPPVRTNLGANLMKNRDAKDVPSEVIIRSEINVKSIPKRSPMSLEADGTPVIHGKRVPDEPIDKIQTWRNARVINNKLVLEGAASNVDVQPSLGPFHVAENKRFERFFKDVNRRYGRNVEDEGRNVYFEWDPANYRNPALGAEVYDATLEKGTSGVQKRMLHPEGVQNYPISPVYTPESQKIAPVALKPGARAPVLQYAHPELGVQPAKILKNEKRRPDNFPENQNSFTEQRHKKKYVLNDKNLVDSYTTKNYYPNQHFYGLKRPIEAPFWVKISENLRNGFSTSVERVSQLTKPVFDPLVEATHKISQNLGLSRSQEAQEKVGTVASGSSILIPALGLVASGAALGIGAVAVGRYLDVDVLKRSNEDADLERRRAMGSSWSDGLQRAEPLEIVSTRGPGEGPDGVTQEDGLILVLEDDSSDAEKNPRKGQVPSGTDYKRTERRRRSLDYLDVFNADVDLDNLVRSKRLQRKGADSISEIVEIDVPARGSINIDELILPKLKRGKGEGSILVIGDELEDPEESSKSLGEPSKSLEEPKLERPAEAGTGNHLEERKTRSRRSVDGDLELEDAFQNLENAEVAEVGHVNGDWTNTPCAKRIFCDTMIQRGPDDAIFMEKKMASLLSLIQPSAAIQVSSHFQEVMEAVRRHDCSSFLCPQARPGNVFF
ncbi:uncharacterized protein LOC105702169 [Orussus abietinus]|uniref:uncharacterized protein LOC105702169 n=1 Tax=Orussus abietinus TaxID=222816 RepID=UPI000625379D|nr:uncharacterized protein LOC105702169 [Orussus abietinus]